MASDTVLICSMTLHQARKDFGHILKAKERIITELHRSRMEILSVLMLNTRHACVLNKQFQSVFTAEDLSSTPQLDSSIYPPIQDLEFSVNGIQALLENLDPSKAPGPDHLSTKVIKL